MRKVLIAPVGGSPRYAALDPESGPNYLLCRSYALQIVVARFIGRWK